MGQQETYGTASGKFVDDTIAFGSMLVFASVMPPLGPDGADSELHGVTKPAGIPDAIEPGSDRKPVRNHGGTAIPRH